MEEPRHPLEIDGKRPDWSAPIGGDRSDEEIPDSKLVAAVRGPIDPLPDPGPGFHRRIEDRKSAQHPSQVVAVLATQSPGGEYLQKDGDRESHLVGVEQVSTCHIEGQAATSNSIG